MIHSHTLFQNGEHRWLAFLQDADRLDNVIDTNQFIVQCGDSAMLLDPGGTEVFPVLLGTLNETVPLDSIRHIFLSHQDPDVGSSLPLWREVCSPDTKIHISSLWQKFISHFDAAAAISPIPDSGGTIRLGRGVNLELVPAHFLHSPGNFQVYDPAARILFTGEVAASLTPEFKSGIFVENFADHTRFMDGWHRRAMGSERARDAWIERAAKMDIAILAPTHGPLLRGDDVRRFLDWFSVLPIGEGIDAIRSGP